MAAMTERLALLVSADTKGAVRGLNEVGRTAKRELGVAESKVQKFSGSFRQAAPIVAAGAAAIGVAMVDVAQSAAKLEASTAAVNATFGSGAGDIRHFAEEAEKLGMSQSRASALAVGLGGQLKGMGFSAEQASEQVQTLTQRAADMAVGIGTTEDAVASIAALIRGEGDPIEKFGISIKQTDINARIAAKGLGHLEGEQKKTAETTARLELLMEQTADKVGLYGSEANTAAREQAEFTAKLENLKARLGASVLPAMNALVTVTNDAIDVGADLASVAGDIAGGFAQAAGAVDGFGQTLKASIPGMEIATGIAGAIAGQFGGKSNLDADAIFQPYIDGTKRLNDGFMGSGHVIGDVTDAILGLGDATAEGAGAIDELADSYNTIFDELFSYQDALRGIDDGQAQVAKSQRSLADAQRNAVEAAEDVRDAQMDVAAAMVVVFDAAEAARRGMADYADEQRAAVDPVFAMIRALEKQDDLLKRAAGGSTVELEGGGTEKSTLKVDAEAAPSLLDLAESASDVEQATIGLAAALRNGDTSIEAVRASLKKWVSQGLLTQKQADALGTELEAVAARAISLEGATVDQAAAAGVAAEQMDAEAEAAERTRDAQERLEDAQDRLKDAQRRVADTAADVSRAHDDAARKAHALDRAMFDLNKEFRDNPALIVEARNKLKEWVDQGLITEEQADDIRIAIDRAVEAANRFEGKKTLELVVATNFDAILGAVGNINFDSMVGQAIKDSWDRFWIDYLNGEATGDQMPGGVPVPNFSGATGGRVPGPMGQERIIKAHGGEWLTSVADQARMSTNTNTGTTYQVTIHNPQGEPTEQSVRRELDRMTHLTGAR